MLTVKIVYNEKSRDLVDQFTKYNGYCFNLETYNEDHYKERKLGFKIKGSCSARELPFVAVYDKGVLIKAFYSEADECGHDAVLQWVLNYLTDNAKKGNITIEKVEGINNEANLIGDIHWGYTNNFIEGLPLALSTPSHWYRTSNVVEIDWEANRFKTKNSIYSFKFNERQSN